jgi:tetratricopeptide (TPR) repeat protein
MSLFNVFSGANLRYECFNCGRDIESPSKLRRKSDRCPACQWLNQVPQKSTTSEPVTPYRLFQQALHASSTGGAIALLKRALELCPTHQRSLKELGILLQDQVRDYRQAAHYLVLASEHAIEPLNGEPVSQFRLNMLDRAATCYSKFGCHAEAATLWERVLNEGRWSTSTAQKIRHDLAAAKALAQGSAAPPRVYGRRGQGAAGIDRVLNSLESRQLGQAAMKGMPQNDLEALVRGWGFTAEDATNLCRDALEAAAQARQAVKQ